MHINYKYLLYFLETKIKINKTIRILDYGCGSGEVVEEGQKRGLNIFGVDIFYQDGNRKQDVKDKGLFGTFVREIKDNYIDFPDQYFDVVINNMVFEHIEDLHHVLREINRVMKPGGIILSLFPTKDCLREGHCGIPFLHLFPHKSRWRFYYAWFLRSIGLGKYKKNHSSAKDWANHWCTYLDQYTHYRSKREIIEIFGTYFRDIKFIEEDYIVFRLSKSYPKISWIRHLITIPIFEPVAKWFFLKLGGVTMVAKKAD